MKIKSINKVGKRKVYDITVPEAEHYILENGVVSHNSGILYSANQVFFIGRRQQKTGTEVTGYDFIINVEKSRFVKEKSKIPITVTWDAGIDKYSALLDLALAGGWVKKPSNGWYQKWDKESDTELGAKVREKQTHTSEFWDSILADESFQTFVKETYTVGYRSMIDTEIFLEEEV